MKKATWWCSIGRAGDGEFQGVEALFNRGAGVVRCKGRWGVADCQTIGYDRIVSINLLIVRTGTIHLFEGDGLTVFARGECVRF